jgi:hypothetical protein
MKGFHLTVFRHMTTFVNTAYFMATSTPHILTIFWTLYGRIVGDHVCVDGVVITGSALKKFISKFLLCSN